MTSTASPQAPLLPARPAARPLWWVLLWLLLALSEVLLLINHARFDTQAWLATRNFLGNPASTDALSWLWSFGKILGNPWFITALVIFIFILSRRRFLIAPAFIAATALPGFISWLIRSIAGRVRPTHTNGANQWILFRGFDLHAKNLSFPSGHATLAFAAAAALVYFFSKTKWLAVPLAAACAFSRVAQQAHFYSDILMGAVLGWTVGWWTAHLIHCRFVFSKLARKTPTPQP